MKKSLDLQDYFMDRGEMVGIVECCIPIVEVIEMNLSKTRSNVKSMTTKL